MKWIPDPNTNNFLCPHCGSMVPSDGYGNCAYVCCPYCKEDVDVYAEEVHNIITSAMEAYNE